KQKVLDIIDEIGYTPNVFARGLGLNTMKTIGIMCTDSSDTYLANAVYFTEHELRVHGYDSILCCTGNKLEDKKKYLNLLLSKRVDAIIMVGSKFLEPKAKDNKYIIDSSKNIPIMLVNGYLDSPNIYCTLCDDFQAIYQTTNLLIEQGKSDILYMYTSNSYSGTRKKEGYLAAFADCGLTINEDYLQLCKKDIYEARDLITTLYKKGLHIQAVITSDDALAAGALKFAHNNNIKVPNELSIIGYNNSILAICSEPELTSIDTKVEALCINTVNTLMKVFEGSNVPSKTTISADVIFRETTNFNKI
ncbi:MAG: LacI family transcriptional regulator, partial [Clostridiales bacterium]|nr:LacI family transcriptional regulator [Clostridiales bacterium]